MTQSNLFDRAPAQSHSATSIAASDSLPPPVLTVLQAHVLSVLRAHPGGMTDEELIDACPAMSPNTPRARRVELWKANVVEDSGHTKHTRSGRSATVWRAK